MDDASLRTAKHIQNAPYDSSSIVDNTSAASPSPTSLASARGIVMFWEYIPINVLING